MAEYFYTDGEGKIRGPVPYKKLYTMAAFGSVPRNAQVMRVGDHAEAEQPWRPLDEVLPPDTLPPPPPKRRATDREVLSFFFGLVTFLPTAFASPPAAGLLGLLAVATGYAAFKDGRGATMSTGRKVMAIIGIILGCMGILVGLSFVILLVQAIMRKP